MPTIVLATPIAAPMDRVFDLSRSIDLHMDSTAHTGERAVAGVTSGLIALGQEVTWRARHLGVWQHLTVRITAMERPHHFTDTMVRGAFHSMHHQHRFEHDPAFPALPARTLMHDEFHYQSPLGLLGKLADHLFLQEYMRRFLLKRNRIIQQAAESENWKRYLS